MRTRAHDIHMCCFWVVWSAASPPTSAMAPVPLFEEKGTPPGWLKGRPGHCVANFSRTIPFFVLGLLFQKGLEAGGVVPGWYWEGVSVGEGWGGHSWGRGACAGICWC